MSATIYLEGGPSGPNSKDLQIRCRAGFRKLLEKCGYGQQSRMPHLIACGSRHSAFEDFKIGLAAKAADDYVALWIDSEDPLENVDTAWEHLRVRNNWTKPAAATDDEMLFMTTCMETLIISDHAALKAHYGTKLQTTALPPLTNLENRTRHEVQDNLVHATRNCTNAYAKGKRSFEVLAKLAPNTLETHLPSFARTRHVLNQKL